MYLLYGTDPSFYTAKVAAQLRVLRLPHEYRLKTLAVKAEVEAAVGGYHRFPVLRRPDGTWLVDSTDIGLALDAAAGGALLPDDPALRLVALMIEDWADEWLLRAALLARATDPATRAWVAAVAAGNLLGVRCGDRVPGEHGAKAGRIAAGAAGFFASAGRVNGVTDASAATIAAERDAALAVLADLLSLRPFLLGGRPSLPDFALWGMLDAGLLWEPSPRATIAERWPVLARFHRRLMEPLAEGGTWSPDVALLAPLLRLIGQGYGAFLAANAAALRDGAAEVEAGGTRLTPRGFTERTRLRLGGWIGELEADARERLDDALAGTGLVEAYGA